MASEAIDPAAYSAMKSTMGEIFDDVINAFMDYVPEQLDKLEHAIKTEDCEQIFNLAHSIKSSCSSIGALGLAQTAEHIELLGRNNTTTGTDEHFQKLSAQFNEAAEFLKHDKLA